MTASQIVLNRRLLNSRFETWRLGGHFVSDAVSVALPAPLRTSGSAAVDFAHTQITALRNHLLQSGGQLYVVTALDSDASDIHEVDLVPSPSFSPIARVPSAAPPAGGLLEPPLDPSLATTTSSSSSSSEIGPGPTDTAAAAAHSSRAALLFSSGRGDLCLVQPSSDPTQEALVSPPLYPLAPAAPLSGVRPFVLEAAATRADGSIICVLWGVKGQQGVDASGNQYRHVCDCHLVTLSVHQGVTNSCSLKVTSTQQLQVTPGPPAGAWLSPGGLNLWLLSDPPLEVAHGGAAAAAAAGAATASTTPASGLGGNAGGLSTAAAAGVVAMDDDDDDDIDPRTLAQAAARLAHLTSEEPVGALPDQGWADVYRESGPEELPGPAISGGWRITTWSISSSSSSDVSSIAPAAAPAAGSAQDPTPTTSSTPQAPPSSSSSAHDSSQPPAVGQPQVKLAGSVSGGPHKLLAVQPLRRGGSSRGSTAGSAVPPGWRLAVADDVDCAVLEVEFDQGSAAPQVEHIGYVPALAYVVAGKQQRRHLLLGQQPCPVTAALVECQQYMYCYGVVDQQAAAGSQQIVPLPLPPQQMVLGAALVATGGGGCGDLLLVLSREQLTAWQV